MKTFIYLFVCFGTCMFCRAQFNVVSVNSVGGPQDDAIFGMAAISGGFIMVGKSGSVGGDVTQNGGCSDVWVIKTNFEGQILAQNSIMLEGCDHATKIIEVNNGYVITATASSEFIAYLLVIKLNMDLEVDWQYVLSDENMGIFSREVVQTSDGGYLVTCSTTDSWLPAETGIIKLNADGEQTNIFWDPLTYGDVLMTSVWDGIVVFYTASNSSDTYAPRMRKYSPQGIELWSQSYHESMPGYVIMAITESADSGVMAASIDNSAGSVNTNINMIKFDSDGLPEYVYSNPGSGNPGMIHYLTQTATGDFIGAGYSTENNMDDIYLFRTDVEGAITSGETLGGSGNDKAFEAFYNGDLFLVGSTTSNDGDFGPGNGMTDGFFMKVSTLLSTEGFGTKTQKIWPVPTQSALNIGFQYTDASIIDLMGKTLQSKLTGTRLDVSGLASGTYFLKVEVNGQSTTHRFVKN